LKVDHVLTGSLRVSGDHAQIDVQLTAIASQTPSWSERYDCNLGDALTVRSEVATKIARAIGLEVLSVPSRATTDDTRASKDAHLEYLRGRLCHSRGTPAGFWRSIQYFERAIYLDPNCAPVFSGLANARGALGGAVFGAGHTRDFYPQAKEAALRALEINNRLSDCHTSMAIVKFYYEWDWAAAERSLCRAIDLEPFSSLAHQIYGRLLSSMRRHEEAIEKATRSCELEPLSAQSHFILGEILYFARQYDQALEAFNTALEFDEMHGPAMLGAGNVYCQMSMFDAAISRMERANALHPDNAPMLALLGAAYARAGRTGAARTTLSKLQAFSKHRYVSPFDLALITAGLGQKNKAIEFLHGAYEESSPLLAKFLLPGNPAFDGLQDDGRYADLVKRVRGNNRKVVV